MCTIVATLASLLVNHRKVEPVSERGNCLFLRAIAISLLLAVALYSLIHMNHRKVEPVRERGNCLLLRSIAISLLLAVALYSLILVTWPLFSKSFATLVHYFLELVHYVLEPGHSLILLSTMS